MADVDITVGAVTGHPSRRGRHTPYLIRRSFNAAAAVAAKGGILATADVIQCIDLPADTAVLSAGLEVTTVDSGTNAPAAVQVGAAVFTTEADLDTLGDQVVLPEVAVVFAADTVDIVLGTLSSAGDDWVVDLWALVCDISAYPTVQSAKGT